MVSPTERRDQQGYWSGTSSFILKLIFFFFSKNIIFQARQRHTYFNRFPHGWAIEEFIKSNLKNKRAYARKRGYLGDQTNRGVKKEEGHDSDNEGDNGSKEGDNGSKEGVDEVDGVGSADDEDIYGDNE